MKTAHTMIQELAAVLDSQHKPTEKIWVRGSRQYLKRVFKPRVRGGSLFVGEHELVVVPPTVPNQPEQVELL